MVTGKSQNVLLYNTVKIKPEVHNIYVEKSHKLNKMLEPTRLATDKKIVHVKEHFVLNNIQQGR